MMNFTVGSPEVPSDKLQNRMKLFLRTFACTKQEIFRFFLFCMKMLVWHVYDMTWNIYKYVLLQITLYASHVDSEPTKIDPLDEMQKVSRSVTHWEETNWSRTFWDLTSYKEDTKCQTLCMFVTRKY